MCILQMEEDGDSCVEFTQSQYIKIYNLRLKQNSPKVNAICLLLWRVVKDWQIKNRCTTI